MRRFYLGCLIVFILLIVAVHPVFGADCGQSCGDTTDPNTGEVTHIGCDECCTDTPACTSACNNVTRICDWSIGNQCTNWCACGQCTVGSCSGGYCCGQFCCDGVHTLDYQVVACGSNPTGCPYCSSGDDTQYSDTGDCGSCGHKTDDIYQCYFYYQCPTPYCTLSLTPATAGPDIGYSTVLTAAVTIYNDGRVTNVTFSSNNTYASVSPLSDTSFPYETFATAVSVGTSTITATATMNTGTTCSGTSTVNMVDSVTPTPTLIPFPNCTNLSCSPNTTVAGQSVSCTADFSSPQGNLSGGISAGQSGGWVWTPDNVGIPGTSGTRSFYLE